MTESEREMLRAPLVDRRYEEGATSLQPTYEDSVEPDADERDMNGWEES